MPDSSEGRPKSHTHIALPHPAQLLERLCKDFAETASVTKSDGIARIEHSFGVATLRQMRDGLAIDAESVDVSALYVLKMALAERIVDAAGDSPPSFAWNGDADANAGIPFFRQMTVRRTRNVTPSMRRVTLTGNDVAHFASGGYHARVLIPPAGRDAVWPRAAMDGRILWPKGEEALTCRVYTVRRVDLQRHELDIDVVVHDDADAPGSQWATRVRPRDPVGLMGPGGSGMVEADWYLLAGDETALPVILRMAEALPPRARAVAVIEVAGREEEQRLQSEAHVETLWLHRGEAAPGTTRLLEAAIRNIEWPSAALATFTLVGCEQSSARAIREYLQKERGMPRSSFTVAGYWRRGASSDSPDASD